MDFMFNAMSTLQEFRNLELLFVVVCEKSVRKLPEGDKCRLKFEILEEDQAWYPGPIVQERWKALIARGPDRTVPLVFCVKPIREWT